MITVSTEQRAAAPDGNANKPSAAPPMGKGEMAQCIVAKPNRSANWQDNKKLMLALAAPCMLIAIAFGVATGTWMILPFAGLELTAIAIVLYIVCNRLQYRHVLIFDNYQLYVEKGRYRPQQVWHFILDSVFVSVERPKHPWDPLKIHLYGNDPQGDHQQVIIGDFLNKQDSQQLLNILRKQGLRIRNDSSLVEIEL